MTVTELVQGSTALERPATAAEVRAQVNLIQEVMKAVMKEGVHFGTIPGTPKPTLYKAGSEKILSTFRIAVEPIVTDLSTADEARFRVEARATAQATGTYLGSGVGEASSFEEKYKWRAAVCQEEFDETAIDRRRTVWKKKDGKPYQVRQVRTQSADVANTILKMAKKRGQIDMTLTVTAASDVFSQDIEDLPEDLRETAAQDDAGVAAKPSASGPRSVEKPKPAAGAGVVVQVQIKDITKKEGQGDKGPWVKTTITGVDGNRYGTFDQEMAKIAREAMAADQAVEIAYTEDKYGRNVQSIAGGRTPGAEG
ncbi:MAG: hypothetical protein ABI652_04040 [Acidobacteriota bacterium]